MSGATDQVRRRDRLDLMTPAELAIYQAAIEVEKAGAHPLLTEAADLLTKARARVADFVDLGADIMGTRGWRGQE